MTIQNMIDNAAPGSIIELPPGLYSEQLVVDKPLTLLGPNPANGEAIIDADGLASAPTIMILSSDVTIGQLTIQNGPLHGIQVGNASFSGLTNVVISSNHIKGHGNAGIITNHGAALTIEENIIENNGLGAGFNRGGIILYPHGTSVVTGNEVRNNTVEGIFARASDAGLVIENNKIENHANSGITLAWDQRNTSILYNDITNCGSGTFDEQGGIVIIQSMAETIRGNIITDCRDSGIFWGWVPTVGNPPAEILISNNTIENSSRDAIYLFSQGPGGFISPDLFPLEPLIKGNVLAHNARAGVYVSNLYYYSPGNAKPIIHNNSIFANQWGVFNGTAGPVDATENWWGDSSGPEHAELNPEGTGNLVSDNVDFVPWLTQPPAIEVLECIIENVSLENYQIIPMGHHKAKVVLTIKAAGIVSVQINGVPGEVFLETIFTKEFSMDICGDAELVPSITASSHCFATLINNEIQVKIKLRVNVAIKGMTSLLMYSYGPCPAPRQLGVGSLADEHLPSIKHFQKQSVALECVTVEKVYHTCWFKETVNHRITDIF